MDNLSISYLRWPVQEVMTFGFYQPLFKEVTLAGLNSLRHKECRISVENWIFDDPFRKRGQYWSFWCLRRSNHQDLEVEVAEANEVNEAAEAFKACKITTEDFRFIQGIEFSFIWMF